jgi:hypothetical protein
MVSAKQRNFGISQRETRLFFNAFRFPKLSESFVSYFP